MSNDQNNTNGAIALHEPTRAGLAMSFDAMKERVLAIDEFYKGVMQEGTDYGVIPGTPKPSLYQPGAQLLDAIFGMVARFEILEGSTIDYDRGFFAYEVRCTLINKQTQEVWGEGIGSCNSMEARYRWRDAKRACPSCGAAAIIKGKAEYGGGWVCFKKQGGCGQHFNDGDQSIESQPLGKIENDDPYTLANTILKMSQKRGHVAATLNATGAGRIFTQDVEDMGDLVGNATPSQPRQEVPQQRPAQRAPQRQAPAPEPPPEYVEAEFTEQPKPAAATSKRQRMEDAYAKLYTTAQSMEIEGIYPLDPEWADSNLEMNGMSLKDMIEEATVPA